MFRFENQFSDALPKWHVKVSSRQQHAALTFESLLDTAGQLVGWMDGSFWRTAKYQEEEKEKKNSTRTALPGENPVGSHLAGGGRRRRILSTYNSAQIGLRRCTIDVEAHDSVPVRCPSGRPRQPRTHGCISQPIIENIMLIVQTEITSYLQEIAKKEEGIKHDIPSKQPLATSYPLKSTQSSLVYLPGISKC
ncbi:hypothetical protein DAPPUDRAFT_233049 [Daphnia pulex]|uniref:Uncharacterized protein n=1 Tax=Daphnia pulex TaxID=6669 RepID=E9FT18_DAPPU|nr:hypothetical protein DAPPUDRAFT_233049 [Daphnia pulex]|eukprot:EFX89293.1 hypothetical protein DAPPUDRAFT_233049 [Daphnia pulex]